MSKICRTCLRKTDFTFKTSQTLGDFGDGTVRISMVLKRIVPELYLGLSANPEVCYTCKENIKVAYLFRKKCIDTENVIGNYLKAVRCTAKTIDLQDMMEFLENSQGKNEQIKSTHSNDTNVNNQQDEVVSDNNPLLLDVRQSAPNPAFQRNMGNMSNCQKFFINNKTNTPQTIIVQPATKITASQIDSSTWGVVNFQNKDNSNSFCKISSVYSLNNPPLNTNENNLDNTNFSINIEQNGIKIKDEPLDIEMKEPDMPLNSMAMDEDTLDASETANFENHYSPGLQKLFENIPEISPDQYVDVPEFVTINNFGLKELEELRLQQQTSAPTPPPKVDSDPLAISPPALLEPNKNEDPKSEKTRERKLVKLSPEEAEKLLKGKHIIHKRGRKDVVYNITQDQMPIATLSGKQVVVKEVQGKETDLIASKNIALVPVRKRNRKRIKIVPVNDQPPVKFKKLKLHKNFVFGAIINNFNSDGVYINDHDYLISPYKRNKVLIEENSQWMCMCFICYKKHYLEEHVDHMKAHGTVCGVCYMNLGSSFMLNLHYENHKKACRYCTQLIPNGLLRSHEEKHIAEENEILEDSEKKEILFKRKRKKLSKDEKPVYFAIPKQNVNEAKKSDALTSEELAKTVIPDDKPESDNSSKEELNNSKKRVRGRNVRKPNVEAVGGTTVSSRTLRMRVKKRYTESDDEGRRGKAESLSTSRGTQSDLIKEAK